MSSSRAPTQLLRLVRPAARITAPRHTTASAALLSYRQPARHTSLARSLCTPVQARLSSSSSSSSASSSTTPPSSPEGDAPSDITRYDFSSITRFSNSLPSPSRILIDVREPAELEASGRIPGAQNLPINSAPDGLFLPAEEFEDRFNFAKPTADSEVVFYCKAGVRSRAAARVARMAGYQKVGEYPGSWKDWEEKGGEVEK